MIALCKSKLTFREENKYTKEERETSGRGQIITDLNTEEDRMGMQNGVIP